MADTFTLEIITPQKIYFTKQVEYLSVETEKGALGIMAHHVDFVSSVKICPIVVKTTTSETCYAISGGTVSINQKQNKVSLFVYAIESQEDIDLNRAYQAKERAQNILTTKPNNLTELSKAEIKMKRALNRIKVKENQ